LRVVSVADRGFASAENRRFLRHGDEHYILGEKLHCGSAEARAALARAGRCHEVAGSLRVKEARGAAGERFVVCYNPQGAERDAAVRARSGAPQRDDRRFGQALCDQARRAARGDLD
jgi:hypothetical protein